LAQCCQEVVQVFDVGLRNEAEKTYCQRHLKGGAAYVTPEVANSNWTMSGINIVVAVGGDQGGKNVLPVVHFGFI
jgi:hypothetical protein